MILLFYIIFRSFYLHSVDKLQCTRSQFVGSTERFCPEHHCAHPVQALCIELLQCIEVEFSFQVAGRILPTTQPLFVSLFLLNQSDGVDTLVHTDRIFPIVGTLRKLRIVFNAHSLICTHVFFHHFLLNTPYLSPRCVPCITSFDNAVTGYVTACTARIAHCH